MSPLASRFDRRLLAAIGLAAVFHGGLLVGGSFRRTYDAYVHIFFADHYARDWFSTWEPRWYTGFTTTSYPPASHQAVGALSWLVGLEWAFVAVQLVAVVGLVIGVHRFSRLWVPPAAAGWAAILAALSSSIAEAVHTFGQLPTTFSLALLLNASPSMHHWIRDGRVGHGILATACTAATTGGHHVTTLFGSVFFLGPVVIAALLDRMRTPLPDEAPGHPGRVSRHLLWPLVARRVRRILPAAVRAMAFGFTVAIALVVVVLPYWLWTSSDPITQIPIPHASRADFLDDRNAGLVFWAVPWGALLPVLPLALAHGMMSRAWPLALSVSLLTVLGTGGTTPVARLLLGGAFDILTLDRFTFWATIGVLPLAGAVVESARRGRLRRMLSARLSDRAPTLAAATFAAALMAMAVFAADLAAFRPFQPDPIDPTPIAAFLDKDQHDRWRYLTLGLGDQMAWVAAHTTATTVDGNYHSARRLPELTSSPVERLEGAKFRGVPGIGSLQQFLANPSKYHVKFVFSNDRFYDPLLAFSGWHRLERLVNDVVVWERADVPPLPTPLLERQAPRWQRFLWGTLPIGTVAIAVMSLLVLAFGPNHPPVMLVAIRRRVGRRLARSTPGRLWRGLDARLAGAAALVRGSASGPAQRWSGWSDRVVAELERPAPRGRRRLIIALVSVAGIGAVSAARPVVQPADPTSVVAAFHDHIDNQRLSAAHSLIDPVAGPTFEQFLLDRSVNDGIVASYGKLERLEVETLSSTETRTVAIAHATYVTALESYETSTEHELVWNDRRWWLVAAPPDGSIPPDQLVRRAETLFRAQGRRVVTTARTDYADVIDRPEVVTVDARLVRTDGRWVIVGEVVNTDVDPADVTVTGQLLDADGEVVAQYDAAQHMIHTLLPKESSSFRIEFEGIAGALDVRDPAAGEFRPGLTTPLAIDDGTVAAFAVYTKAVVTDRGLDRSLELLDLRVVPTGAGDADIEGTLRNGGTEEVTIPHLLVTHRDDDGRVRWVDHAYVEHAIRPQRSVAFTIAVQEASDVTVVDLPGATFDNGLVDAGWASPTARTLLATRGLDVQAHGFLRGGV